MTETTQLPALGYFLLLFLASGLAELVIPGCPSYKYRPPVGVANATQCFCEPAGGNDIDITCVRGARTKDVLATVARVAAVATTVENVKNFFCTDVDFSEEIPEGFLADLPPVKDFTIRACEKRLFMHDNAFGGQEEHIESFTLSRCYFTNEIDPNANLHPAVQKIKALVNLTYTGSNLFKLNASSFANYRRLERLDMGYNMLVEISEDAFTPLAASLLSLDLSQNFHIEGRLLNQVAKLKRLEELILHEVKIDSVEPGQFSNLTNLRKLHLNTNDFTVLPTNAFAGLSKLELLVLQAGLLNRTEPGTFNGLDNLKTLLLGANWLDELEDGSFTGLPQLEYLQLSYNEIQYLQPGLFQPLNRLKNLELSSNGRIGNLSDGVFDGLSNLEVLDISDTGIKNLTGTPFLPLTKLRRLNLGRSLFLSDISEQVFDGLNSLTFLMLNKTALDTLPEGIFEPLISLQLLDISANPWYCESDLAWLIQWIQRKISASTPLVLVNWEETLCNNPEPLYNFYLHNLDTSFLLERGGNYSVANVTLPATDSTTTATEPSTTTRNAFGFAVNDILQVGDGESRQHDRGQVRLVILSTVGVLMIVTLVALTVVTYKQVQKNRKRKEEQRESESDVAVRNGTDANKYE